MAMRETGWEAWSLPHALLYFPILIASESKFLSAILIVPHSSLILRATSQTVRMGREAVEGGILRPFVSYRWKFKSTSRKSAVWDSCQRILCYECLSSKLLALSLSRQPHQVIWRKAWISILTKSDLWKKSKKRAYIVHWCMISPLRCWLNVLEMVWNPWREVQVRMRWFDDALKNKVNPETLD